VVIILILAGLLVGLWALFLATVEGNFEQAAMYLPMPLLLLGWLMVKTPTRHAIIVAD
jgi:hypothetical protein